VNLNYTYQSNIYRKSRSLTSSNIVLNKKLNGRLLQK